MSLSVNKAMPPMPEFSWCDVIMELKVSAHGEHFEYLPSLAQLFTLILLRKHAALIHAGNLKITVHELICS